MPVTVWGGWVWGGEAVKVVCCVGAGCSVVGSVCAGKMVGKAER